MRSLLEIRDKILRVYNKSEFIVLPILKFMLAFLALSIVSGKLGYMYQLDNLGLVLILSLMCSFLPNGFIVFFAVVLSVAHIYALSLEVAIVALAVYLIIFLVFFRFCAGNSTILLFTALMAAMNIPYVVPIAVGLLASPGAIFAVACGLIGFQMLDTVVKNAASIHALGEDEITAKIRLIVDNLINNKELLIMIIAFAFTIIVVYLVRRLSIDYCWTIAVVAGVIVNLVILLIGDLMYDTNMSLGMAFLGSLLALAVGKVIEFFRFSIDYSRIENVQFEDDEYYYYVKAIPKMTVAAPEKTVKTINTQKQTPVYERNTMQRNSSVEKNKNAGRSVTTERIAGQRTVKRDNEHLSGGKSVTVGKRTVSEIEAFFEDLDNDINE